MILYHGTNRQFTSFDENFFGKSENHENGAIGVWASLTPVSPMKYGREVLVLKIEKPCIKEIRNKALLELADDDNDHQTYRDFAFYWISAGFNVLAITEWDDTIGNVVVLDPAAITILERVPREDVARLRELEIMHRDDELFSKMSEYVSCLDPGSRLSLDQHVRSI